MTNQSGTGHPPDDQLWKPRRRNEVSQTADPHVDTDFANQPHT